MTVMHCHRLVCDVMIMITVCVFISINISGLLIIKVPRHFVSKSLAPIPQIWWLSWLHNEPAKKRMNSHKMDKIVQWETHIKNSFFQTWWYFIPSLPIENKVGKYVSTWKLILNLGLILWIVCVNKCYTNLLRRGGKKLFEWKELK